MDERTQTLFTIWMKAGEKPAVEELCKDTPELASGLRALIDEFRALDRQMGGEPGDATMPTSGLAPSFRPTLRAYQLLEMIGKGAMGVVWSAIQISTQRRVAVKLLNPLVLSQPGRERFQLEVVLAARLDHPHIARVFESGEDAGTFYYAMELVEGDGLDAWAWREQPDQRRTVEMMLLICRAVEHAHQRGIIHRDLKPSNIMVNHQGEPRVLDFGLARDLESDPTLSLDGQVAGTPGFMSPEQARGQRDAVDTRSDVYSLGTILATLLTGKNPHDLSGSAWDIVLRTREGRVNALSAACPDLDRELQVIIHKAMAFEPADRYGTAGALADDLQRYLRSEPLAARPPTLIYFATRHFRRHRKRVILSALAGLALLLAGIAWVWSVKYQRDQAVQARNTAQNQRLISDQRAREANEQRLHTLLVLEKQVFGMQRELDRYQGPLKLRQKMLESALADLEQLAADAGDERPGILRLRAAALLHLGDVRRAQGRDAAAVEAYERAIADLRQFAAHDPAQVRSRRDLEVGLLRLGRLLALSDPPRARAAISEVMTIIDDALSRKPGAIPPADRRAVLAALGDLALAENADEALRQYSQASKTPPEIPEVELAGLHLRSAKAHLQRDRAEDAERAMQLCDEGIALIDRALVGDPANPSLKRERAAALARRCQVLNRLRRTPEAADAGSEAVQILQPLVSAAPDHAELRVELASACLIASEVLAANGDTVGAGRLRDLAREQIEGLTESKRATELLARIPRK